MDLTKYIEESYFNFNAAFDENGSNEEVFLLKKKIIKILLF